MTTAAKQGRLRAILFTAGSLAVAGLTALAMHQVISGYRERLAEAQEEPPTIAVVVARQDLPAGTPISAADLDLVPVIPREDLKASVYYDAQSLVGMTPSEPILAGEIIRRERLLDEGEAFSLTSLVEPGNRALTIQAERDAVVAGLLAPGDHVDVIVTIRPDTNDLNANWVTETILQGVRVLAVGATLLGESARPAEEEEGRRSELVTLEISPEEAEKLAMAAARGDLHLSLRAEEDAEIQENRGPLVTNALVGLAPQGTQPTTRRPSRRAPPAAPRRETAEVIEGTRTSVEQFDAEGRKVTPAKPQRR